MKKFTLFLLTVFPIILPAQPAKTSLAFSHVNVIDVRTGEIKKNVTVIITGNRITSVGKKASVPKNARVINATDKYLIPGLWDMHVHIFLNDRQAYSFPLFIANGVTGIRDLGSSMSSDSIQLLRQKILSGKLTGPRIQSICGKIINGEGQGDLSKIVNVARTPEEGREWVRAYKQKKIDFIKVYDMLSRETYLSITKEAKLQKIPVEGHVPFSMTAVEASGLGQRSIEHLTGVFISCSTIESELRKELNENSKQPKDHLSARQAIEMKAVNTYDPAKASALFATFVKNDTWHCPTLALRGMSIFLTDSVFTKGDRLKYIPFPEKNRWKSLFTQRLATANNLEQRQKRLQRSQEVVREMHRAGVKILAGTDILNPYLYPGFSLHEELTALVQAGLSNLEALKTATINPAIFFNKQDLFGTIDEGKLADLVLLDANPLDDINNTRKINAVVANGKLLQRKDLDKLLDDVEESVTGK